MSWQAGAFRKFRRKPTDGEISAAKKSIAEELTKAIEASDFIVKPFGDSGEWTVGCKITLDGNESDRPMTKEEWFRCIEEAVRHKDWKRRLFGKKSNYRKDKRKYRDRCRDCKWNPSDI